MINNGVELALDRACKLCTKVFENGVVLEDWRNAMIVHYKMVKRGQTLGTIGTIALCVVHKIYVGILMNKVHKITKRLTDDE